MKKKMLGMLTLLATSFVATSAFAQEGAAGGDELAYGLLASGLGLGLAVLGGALGQGRAAAAALEGIARNPGATDKLFTPMILGLALIESLVIFAFVIAYMILGKV